MKKIFLLLLMCFEAFGQGGPNGPPNPACFGPNPPPWCNNPPVPMDDWQLILVAFLIGIIIGYSSLNKTFNTKKNRRKPIILGANEISTPPQDLSTPPQDLSTPPQISDALKKRKLETFKTKER